jgi:hypothetical protein
MWHQLSIFFTPLISRARSQTFILWDGKSMDRYWQYLARYFLVSILKYYSYNLYLTSLLTYQLRLPQTDGQVLLCGHIECVSFIVAMSTEAVPANAGFLCDVRSLATAGNLTVPLTSCPLPSQMCPNLHQYFITCCGYVHSLWIFPVWHSEHTGV